MKTQNQEMIQQLMDEGEYAPSYPFVLQSKLTPLEKLLIGLMLNDIRMNGTITWKHNTYADKLGSSRQVIMKLFRKLEKNNILIANENNKPGSKSNTFEISFSSIEEYSTCNQRFHDKPETSGSKPETSGSKPETSGSKPETSGSKPETRSIHIKKSKETNKENNKKILKTEDEPSFFVDGNNYNRNDIKSSNAEHLKQINKKDIKEEDMDIFLKSLGV